MPLCWFADAHSLEYLDLYVHEFRKRPISALNFCIAPKRYFRLCDYLDLESSYGELHEDSSSSVCVRKISLIPSRKLFEVFKPIVEKNTPVYFLNACIDSMVEKLSTNWESETFRHVLNFVKAFSDYAGKSLFPVHYYNYNRNSKFNKTPLVYNQLISHLLRNSLQDNAYLKLMQVQFVNVCRDSKLLSHVFSICIQQLPKLHRLFMCDANVTEYILHRMKRENYNIKSILETAQEGNVFNSLIRSNPEHLLVFLNNGFEIVLKAPTKCIPFHKLHPYKRIVKPREVPSFLSIKLPDFTPRESAVLEIVYQFLTWEAPQFVLYLDCLRLIWRSIPDAFVTYHEMVDILLDFVDIVRAIVICRHLKKYEFDSFEVILQPRSLMHYSRCALRDALKRNSQLPEGIELLHLPPKLKSFLKLHM